MKTIVEKIAMGCKPDPYKFTIKETRIINGNTIMLANYHGCLSFGGDKLMLLAGEHVIGETLDPHFLDNEYAVRARFIPTSDGWKLAELCANNL
jgi:hypothetical protein